MHCTILFSIIKNLFLIARIVDVWQQNVLNCYVSFCHHTNNTSSISGLYVIARLAYKNLPNFLTIFLEKTDT